MLALLFCLLFGRLVEQLLLEFSNGRMVVSVAHYSIHGSGDVSPTHVANNHRSIVALEVGRPVAQPIVVLNGCLNAAVAWQLYTHTFQECSWTAQVLQKLPWRTFPKVHVKGFIPDN